VYGHLDNCIIVNNLIVSEKHFPKNLTKRALISPLATFEKRHPLAHAHNLRFIILNHRGYRGSSEFTDDLNKGKKEFLDRLAVQMMEFSKVLIESEEIPRVKDGEIVLLEWSMGVTLTIPLFSDLAVVKKELYDA